MPKYKDAYLSEDVVNSWRAVFFQDTPQDDVLVIPAVRGVTRIKRVRVPDLKCADGTRTVFSYNVYLADVTKPITFKYEKQENAVSARNYLLVKLEEYYNTLIGAN